jgi:hypothetical protein
MLGLHMLKMKKLLAAIASLVMAGTLAAHAGSITNTAVWNQDVTDWSSVVAVAKFDQALGILQEMIFVVHSDLDTQFTVSNKSTRVSKGNVYTQLALSIQDPANLVTNPQLDVGYPETPFAFNLNPGQVVTSGLYTASADSTNSYTSWPTLRQFVGDPGNPGTISLTGFTETYTVARWTGGNVDANQTSHANATATIIYNYTIPEPMQVSLLVMGGALGVLRRRLRKVQRTVPI